MGRGKIFFILQFIFLFLRPCEGLFTIEVGSQCIRCTFLAFEFADCVVEEKLVSSTENQLIERKHSDGPMKCDFICGESSLRCNVWAYWSNGTCDLYTEIDTQQNWMTMNDVKSGIKGPDLCQKAKMTTTPTTTTNECRFLERITQSWGGKVDGELEIVLPTKIEYYNIEVETDIPSADVSFVSASVKKISDSKFTVNNGATFSGLSAGDKLVLSYTMTFPPLSGQPKIINLKINGDECLPGSFKSFFLSRQLKLSTK